MKFLILLLVLFSTNIQAQTSCRKASVKHKFDVSQGYPKGRVGYVVDHVCALANGGKDEISNMQYQTIADGKIKDRIENTVLGRKLYCNSKNSTPTRQVFNCK